MKVLLLLAIIAATSGFALSNAYAVSPNSAFILEGSGFAVTEEIIRFSELDLAVSTQQQSGSSILSLVEDGFITLDEEDFLATELSATMLREGKYMRINGIAESPTGEEASVRFFGRLVEESREASVYGFTGRITSGGQEYKIVYTAKLSQLTSAIPAPTETIEEDDIIIHILKGSSNQGIVSSYIEDQTLFRYFSIDRISVEPGTSIIIVNDDIVSHSILSGKENYGDRYNPYTPDGRIDTGEILPGESVTITFDEAGFYRLYDPDYYWMDIIGYVFPNVDSLILGKGQNLGN